jgi:hypothetical protein
MVFLISKKTQKYIKLTKGLESCPSTQGSPVHYCFQWVQQEPWSNSWISKVQQESWPRDKFYICSVILTAHNSEHTIHHCQNMCGQNK